jgi:hypothetical protein
MIRVCYVTLEFSDRPNMEEVAYGLSYNNGNETSIQRQIFYSRI